MFARLASERLRALAEQFPAVTIVGPRQVGKTTLARATFPSHAYVDLESPVTRELFHDDPRFHLELRSSQGIVLDEAQSVPALFPALRGLIDGDRTAAGRFILLGSAQPSLVRQVSESLAGRVAVLELDPLTPREASTGEAPVDWRDLWLRGGFPDALRQPFREWHEQYLRTYVERDLGLLGIEPDPIFARRLLTMLAHQQGGLLNLSDLARALGVSVTKVGRWLDIFESTFLIRRLTPYFRHVGKRLTKAPKVYLRDTGLLHHLLNISESSTLHDHPIRGASFETLVIEDLIRRERLIRPFTQAFFWRTHAGAEIDLLLERGDHRVAVEIKAGHGTSHAARRLADAARDADAGTAWVVDQGEAPESLSASVSRRGFGQSHDWLPDVGGVERASPDNSRKVLLVRGVSG